MKIALLNWRNPHFKSWEERIGELLTLNYDIAILDRSQTVRLPGGMDIVINLSPHYLPQCIQFKEKGMAFIQYWFGTPPAMREEWKEMVQMADKHIVLSEWGKERLRDFYAIDSEVNPLGVDVDFASGIPCTSDRKDFIYIGGCWAHKRVDWLIRNVADLILVGGETMKNEYGDKAMVTDHLTDIEKFELLGRCKALVHASRMEGFNIPISEALYMETPCILFDLELYHSLYGDIFGKAITLFQDEEELSKLTKDMPDLDGKMGREFILKEGYTLQMHVERLGKIIEEFL